ncbi:MAG: Decaprenyl-phosphate N-acetylglucosaminephosphotransferase, partial [uncultured Acidimicrobiales bacterium]
EGLPAGRWGCVCHHLRPHLLRAPPRHPLRRGGEARRAPGPPEAHADDRRSRHVPRLPRGHGRGRPPRAVPGHLPRLIGAPRHRDRGRHHVRRRHGRRPPGVVTPRQDGRPGAGRHAAVPAGGGHVLLPDPLCGDRLDRPRPPAPAHRAVGHRHGQRRELHRRPRRAGGRHRRHRRRGVLPLRHPPVRRSAARAEQRGPAGGDHHGRHLPRLPAPQLPRQDHDGRRRRAVPRPVDGGLHTARRGPHRRPVQRQHVLLLRPHLHPLLHPGRPDHRHRVRHHPPVAARHVGRPRRSRPPALPAPHPGPWAASRRPHPVGVDSRAVRPGARADLHRPGQRDHPPGRGGAVHPPVHLLPPGCPPEGVRRGRRAAPRRGARWL